MLSPGDVVFLDGKNEPSDQRYTVVRAVRAGDLNTGAATNYYELDPSPASGELIPASRISAHWVQA